MAGNQHGKWCHENRIQGSLQTLAMQAATGEGMDAQVIPSRWRDVFIKAFKISARPQRRRKKHSK